jgi:MYND finger
MPLSCFCNPRNPEDTGAVAATTESKTMIDPFQTPPHDKSDNKGSRKNPHRPREQHLKELSMKKKLPFNDAVVLAAAEDNTGWIQKTKSADDAGDGINTHARIENECLSYPEAEAAANYQHTATKSRGKKSYPQFHNVHPPQKNVQAKLEYFQKAFADDSHEPTETATTAREDDDDTAVYETTKKPPLVRKKTGDDDVIDCCGDPFEDAYNIWYRKGMLRWRPASCPKLPPSTVKKAMVPSVETSFYRETACASCGKAITNDPVHCARCSETLYCTVICRGKHLHLHSPSCAPTPRSSSTGADVENATPTPTTVTPPPLSKNSTPTTPDSKSPVILGFSPDLGPHSQGRSRQTSGQVPMVSLFAASNRRSNNISNNSNYSNSSSSAHIQWPK